MRARVFRDQEWRVLIDRLGLSSREAEITQRVFDDLGTATIARDLGLAPSTVRTYLKRLYRKLGVRSRGELLILVFLEFLRANEASDFGLVADDI
ncbi:LuxR C-terminal-related transcriptional regulator [Candidatus Palauibacter scopulicola]|uniref:LuxR C-terminal-related transcriptional regulator n=1 Tax=Candidatus Palauibacter scopulicola TaxID=3056741 RepID=UPI0031B85A56